MPRTYVITGSASGIGKATRQLLETQGHRVIGVDLADAEVIADLGTPSGRDTLVDGVRANTGGHLDAVIASAGVGHETPETIRVNYFGAVATIAGLRPLLAHGTAPRAVLLSLGGVTAPGKSGSCRCVSRRRGRGSGHRHQGSSRSGVCVVQGRTRAVDPAYRGERGVGGAGILLNAVAPGLIETPMMEPHLAIDEVRAMLDQALPMPLGGHGKSEQVAEFIAWLTSPQNSMITGQVIFIDGGTDAMIRGDSTW